MFFLLFDVEVITIFCGKWNEKSSGRLPANLRIEAYLVMSAVVWANQISPRFPALYLITRYCWLIIIIQ